MQVGTQGLQRIHRGGPVARADELVAVLAIGDADVGRAHHLRGRIGIFAGAGNDVDPADHRAQRIDGSHDLEGELRNAVAECIERHAFEDHIGEATVGRRIVGAFLGDDQRIGRLVLRAVVQADRVERLVDLAPVGPDASHLRDRPFAETDGEIGEIAVVGAARR